MPQLATNVDITDLIPLARNIAKFHIGETAGFPAARGEQDVGKIGDCVIPQTLEYNVKELHKFLFDEEDYQVPSNVKEYSSHIAQVTGLTTNAKLIGHVPVDQGVSAQTFIKKRASRIAAQAAAKDAAKKSSTSASDESDDESGMRPRRARARARSDWTRSLIRMKTGLTGRKKSRRATAVRDQEQRRLPARKIIRIRQPRRMILYPDQAAHRRRSLPLQTGIYNHDSGRDSGIQ